MINSIKFLLVFVGTMTFSIANAQMPGGAGRGQMGGQNMSLGHL